MSTMRIVATCRHPGSPDPMRPRCSASDLCAAVCLRTRPDAPDRSEIGSEKTDECAEIGAEKTVAEL